MALELQRFHDLDDFVDRMYRDRPDTIAAGELAKVKPNPWIWRTGTGKAARIRMRLGAGKLRYWRRPNEDIWYRVDWTRDFDIGSNDRPS